MDSRVFWIWLSHLLGPCSLAFVPLLAHYGDPARIYDERRTLELVAMLPPKSRALDPDAVMEDAKITLEQCDKTGITVIPWCDSSYPELLRDTGVPPVVLYATGDVTSLNGFNISGVGTRNMTSYGKQAVAAICMPLAAVGVTLVSGLAHGIDSEVHKAALKQGAKTVAVLGTGIDTTYPSSNATLRSTIENNGCVISELAPGAEYNRASFPQRNRIIAGVSRGVIIFEAAVRSGTMVTANWALEYSREVMCVPGSILSTQSEGANLLIKQGATPVTEAADVLAVLGMDFLKPEAPVRTDNAIPKLTGIAGAAYAAVAAGCTLEDEIVAKTGYPPAAIRVALSELEIDGILENRAGIYKILK